MSKRYNGYDNYPTWRVMTEILGNIEFNKPVTIDKLKEIVEEDVFIYQKELMEAFARAFLSDVNYYEIERTINEDIPITNENNWQNL